MEGHQQSGFSLPSTWLELNVTTLDYLLAITVFLGTVSLFSAVSGEPETMALVAVAGITVVVLGTTFIRLSEHLRTIGMSLPGESVYTGGVAVTERLFPVPTTPDVKWSHRDWAESDVKTGVLIEQQNSYTTTFDTTGMNIIAGVILFSVGSLGFLWPVKTLRFWFLGMLSENAITGRGRVFFRVLGGVCALASLGIAILG